MIYQILARANADVAWEPFQAMTRDPLHALTLLRKAMQTYADVSVIQAETATILREQMRRLRAGEPSGDEACPLPSLSATPRISLVGPTIEHKRWAIEQGPGGDHDVPYRFESTVPAQILARWAKLLGHAHRRANETETLAELSLSADLVDQLEGATCDEATEAPARMRSERIGSRYPAQISGAGRRRRCAWPIAPSGAVVLECGRRSVPRDTESGVPCAVPPTGALLGGTCSDPGGVSGGRHSGPARRQNCLDLWCSQPQ